MGIKGFTTFAKSVSTTPVKISGNSKRIGLLIVNNSSSAILYIMSQPNDINSVTGIPVYPQRSFETLVQCDIWIISDTISTDVRICEVIE